jgi:hypothetical protein
MYILDLNDRDSVLGIEHLTIEEILLPKTNYHRNHHQNHHHRNHHQNHHHRDHHPSYFYNNKNLLGGYPYSYFQGQNTNNTWFSYINNPNCTYIPGCLFYLSNLEFYYDISISMFGLFMIFLLCSICQKKRTKTTKLKINNKDKNKDIISKV